MNVSCDSATSAGPTPSPVLAISPLCWWLTRLEGKISRGGEFYHAITCTEWVIAKGHRRNELRAFEPGAELECAIAYRLEIFVANDLDKGGSG